ncbi:ABC transporter permease [Rhizocola hellebori]|uniref:ABC transporter permease n=1 Tax=Rhizocola hellebori TaxID=1392758 RepID=UPI0019454D0D|nr:ABC transporter permease [Rhizocola hellebori]
MLRVILSHLRRRPGRASALLLGMVVATTGFAVLTGSTATSRLQVTGTVERNSRGAYDVLVRPQGTVTELERSRGLVQPNFLGGQYGGITAAQLATVRQLAGVEVAAPIAMLGQVFNPAWTGADITAAVDPTLTRQIIEVSPRWRADAGLSNADDSLVDYVYLTKRPVIWPVGRSSRDGAYSDGKTRPLTTCDGAQGRDPIEVQEDGSESPICLTGPKHDSQERLRFIYAIVHLDGDGRFWQDTIDGPRSQERLRVFIPVSIPQLVAAIDPQAEARLVGLDRAVIDGRYLNPDEPAEPMRYSDGSSPVDGAMLANALYANRLPLDEQVALQTRGVAVTGLAEVADRAGLAAAVAGKTAIVRDYGEVTEAYTPAVWATPAVDLNPWSDLRLLMQSGPLTVTELPSGELAPQALAPAANSWPEGGSWLAPVPVLAGDVGFRKSVVDLRSALLGKIVATRTVGVFDPTKLAADANLGRVPLETYRAATAAAQGRTLSANTNPSGYLTMPPSVLLALDTILANDAVADPISAIRVRVAGVAGVDPVSNERVRLVAEQIAAQTGLAVDIVVGSSPAPQRVRLPGGNFGRPPLLLTEEWTRKGVSLAIIEAVDRKSAMLFGLILVVCVLFLANAVTAAVSERRRELAILACLGWSPGRIAAAVTGEVSLLGLLAGVCGGGAALGLGALLDLEVPFGRAALAVPVAVGLAVIAALVPAWQAARAHPRSLLERATADVGGRGGRHRSIAAMALGNLRRNPARTAVAALALLVGTAGLTGVVAVNRAFHGSITGSLLGDAVSVQVRAVDTVAVVVTLLLGLGTLADVLYLNVTQRSSEFAVLQAIGWSAGSVNRLIAYEGLAIGLLGAVSGALVGVAAAAWLARETPGALLWVSAAVALTAVMATTAALVAPALAQRRLPISTLLAQE